MAHATTRGQQLIHRQLVEVDGELRQLLAHAPRRGQDETRRVRRARRLYGDLVTLHVLHYEEELRARNPQITDSYLADELDNEADRIRSDTPRDLVEQALQHYPGSEHALHNAELQEEYWENLRKECESQSRAWKDAADGAAAAPGLPSYSESIPAYQVAVETRLVRSRTRRETQQQPRPRPPAPARAQSRRGFPSPPTSPAVQMSSNNPFGWEHFSVGHRQHYGRRDPYLPVAR